VSDSLPNTKPAIRPAVPFVQLFRPFRKKALGAFAF
jgi:hypothetical protein